MIVNYNQQAITETAPTPITDITSWGMAKDRDVLMYISELYKDLCDNYNYGYVSNGKIYKFGDQSDTDYFYSRYRTISVSDFEKYKTGVCWDFTRYQYTMINKKFPNIKVKNYYFVVDLSPDYPTHTVTVVPISTGYVYIEVSWYDFRSLTFFYDKKKLLSTIATRHRLWNKGRRNNSVGCFEYDDPNTLAGLKCDEFMNIMIDKPEIAIMDKMYAPDKTI